MGGNHAVTGERRRRVRERIRHEGPPRILAPLCRLRLAFRSLKENVRINAGQLVDGRLAKAITFARYHHSVAAAE